MSADIACQKCKRCLNLTNSTQFCSSSPTASSWTCKKPSTKLYMLPDYHFQLSLLELEMPILKQWTRWMQTKSHYFRRRLRNICQEILSNLFLTNNFRMILLLSREKCFVKFQLSSSNFSSRKRSVQIWLIRECRGWRI